MSTKYFSGREGRYIFCDICGQACYEKDVVKLDARTGRGGLLVCLNDADKIDMGLVPYVPNPEHPVRWTRINHTDVTDGSPPADVESSIIGV